MKTLAAIALGLAFFAPQATAETRFQIVECQPDLPCRFRGASLSSETACGLDAASLAFVVPSGTRIRCVRVQGFRDSVQGLNEAEKGK